MVSSTNFSATLAKRILYLQHCAFSQASSAVRLPDVYDRVPSFDWFSGIVRHCHFFFIIHGSIISNLQKDVHNFQHHHDALSFDSASPSHSSRKSGRTAASYFCLKAPYDIHFSKSCSDIFLPSFPDKYSSISGMLHIMHFVHADTIAFSLVGTVFLSSRKSGFIISASSSLNLQSQCLAISSCSDNGLPSFSDMYFNISAMSHSRNPDQADTIAFSLVVIAQSIQNVLGSWPSSQPSYLASPTISSSSSRIFSLSDVIIE